MHVWLSKDAKKVPAVNKFKALVRYEQVYGNIEYRIVCLKTILATPSGLNSASFELETYDQAMTKRVFLLRVRFDWKDRVWGQVGVSYIGAQATFLFISFCLIGLFVRFCSWLSF